MLWHTTKLQTFTAILAMCGHVGLWICEKAGRVNAISLKKLVVTSASLVVTGALLVVTRSY